MSGSCQRLRLPSFAGLGGGGSGLGHHSHTTNGSHSSHSSPQRQQHQRTSAAAAAAQQTKTARTALGKCKPTAAAAAASSTEAAPYEQHRIIMMGSERVGKTSIVSQFLYDKWTPRYRRTTEDLHRGEYELADGASLTLDILDTCGAREFPAMRQLSIQYGNAFVLVYAVDAAETWTEVTALREVILQARGAQMPIVVVGNKSDVDDERRQVEWADAERECREQWRCGFVECSAKDNVGIVEVFKALLKQANINYNLSPAVRRRRLSLPAIAPASAQSAGAKQAKYSVKRHSCTVS